MANLTRDARAAQSLNAVRGRFLDRLGDDATPERVMLAHEAAKLVLKVAALEAQAERRPLTVQEADNLLRLSGRLGVVTRCLGIEPEPRRGRPG